MGWKERRSLASFCISVNPTDRILANLQANLREQCAAQADLMYKMGSHTGFDFPLDKIPSGG